MSKSGEINPAYKGTLYLPGDLYEAAQAVATRRRTSLKSLIIEALRDYLSTDSGQSPDIPPHPAGAESGNVPSPETQAKALALIRAAATVLEQDLAAVAGTSEAGRKLKKKAG